MSNSISNRMNSHYPTVDPTDIRILLNAVLADLAGLRETIVSINMKLDAVPVAGSFVSTAAPPAATLLA